MAKKIILTEEQKRALQLDKNLIVTAGAGSGKTAVLTERYNRILARFLEREPQKGLRNILVLTFTEKAAGEMKERIYGKIISILNAGDDLDPKTMAAWQSYKDEFLDNKISTFHSFCAYILRAHPLEAEVDPNYQIVEGFEQGLLLQESLERELNQRAKSKDESLGLLLQIWSRRQLFKVMELMLNRRNSLYPWRDFYSNNGEDSFFRRWFDLKKFNFEQIFAPASDLLTILRDISFLESLPVPREDSGMTFITILCQFYKELREELSELKEIEKAYRLRDLATLFLDSKGEYKKFKHHSQIGTKGNWKQCTDEQKQFIELAESLQEVLESIIPCGEVKFLPSPLDGEFTKYIKALAELFSTCVERYQSAKEEKGFLDYTDLEYKAHRLLYFNEGVRNELAHRYRYIMVDEFQDTNDLQWEIIKALALDKDGSLLSDKIFLVGDTKQAIYSFRGGDVRVFLRAEKELSERGNFELVAFENNFRSAEIPIQFFNDFFKRMLGEENLADYEASHQALKKANPAKINPGKVEISIIFKMENRLASLEREVLLVAQRTQEALLLQNENAHTRKNTAKVAILLRRLTNVRLYAEAIYRQGLSVAIIQGKGFYEQQEIYDLYNLLAFLGDQNNDIALAGVLRSPLLSFNDKELYDLSRRKNKSLWDCINTAEDQRIQDKRDMLKGWLFFKDRLGIAALLRLIIADTHFYLAQGLSESSKQRIRNIEKFIEMARDFEQKGASLTDFHEYISQQIQLQVSEGQAATDAEADVVIMSIHQAKGLEFPIVIVPDLGGKFNLGLSESIYMNEVRENVEVAMAIPHPQTGYMESPSLREQIKDRVKIESLAEEKRILYVAATRAEEQLYLIGLDDEKESDPEKDFYELSSFTQWVRKACDFPREEDVDLSEAGGFTYSFADNTIRPLEIMESKTPDTLSTEEEEFCELSAKLIEFEPPRKKVNRLVLPKIIELSPTGLALYKECPLRYKYKSYLVPEQLIPTGPIIESLPAKESLPSSKDNQYFDSAKFGEMVHRLLQKGIISDNQEEYLSILEEIIDKANFKYYLPKLKEHLNQFKNTIWHKRMQEATKNYQELPFKYNVLQTEEYRVYLHGIVDSLLLEGEDWRILDFKTTQLGANTPKEITYLNNYDLQLNCYSLALDHELKKRELGRIKEGIIIFTETGDWVKIPNEDSSKEVIISLLEKIINEEFEPKPGIHCRYCEYGALCKSKQ